MTKPAVETCAVCGVSIHNGDRVMFSTGAPATRGRLWARVCQYTTKNPKKESCINQNQERIGEVSENDYYRPI